MSRILRLPQNYKNKTQKSVHNLDKSVTTTIHTGLWYPVYRRHFDAGEKGRVSYKSLLQSSPLVGPLMGAYILRTVVAFDPDSNVYGWLDNNDRQTTEEILSKRKHFYTFRRSRPTGFAEYNKAKAKYEVGRGGLWDMMGIPPGSMALGSTNVDGQMAPYGCQWNIGFLLSYLNIWRTYLMNNQESRFPVSAGVINWYNDASAGPTRDRVFDWFDVKELDRLFKTLRSYDDGKVFVGSQSPIAPIDDSVPRTFIDRFLDYSLNAHGGLLPATYEPDIYRNLLNDSDGKVVSRVVTSDNGFTIDTLRFQNKLQRFVDRIDVSGGRFSDWLRTVWGVRTSKHSDTPDLLGVHSQVIDPSNIVSASDTADLTGSGGGANIGQLAGYVDQFGSRARAVTFRASEPGNLIVMQCLIPLVDYGQNIQYDLLNNSFADDYNPEFAQLGFQSVPKSDYTGLPVWKGPVLDTPWLSGAPVSPFSERVGKQVAWLHKMTDTNRVHGEFSNGGFYETWVLKRRFQFDKDDYGAEGAPIGRTSEFDLTQYINPLDWQYPFVAQTIEDPNFYLNVMFEIPAVRAIGKRFMPTLE